MKILYANGCSMVEGCELGNAEYEYDESKTGPITSRAPYYNLSPQHIQHMQTHCWSYVLKCFLEIQNYQNGARAGAGGKHIVKTTIIDVLALLENYKPEEIFVVIGWTRINRFEFLDPSGVEYQFAPGTNAPSRSLLHPKIREMASIYETYIAQNLKNNQLQHFIDVIELQNFLVANKIKFMFSYGTYENMKKSYSENDFKLTVNDDTIKLLHRNIDDSNFIFYGEHNSSLDYRVRDIKSASFEHFAFSNNYPIGNGQHPLEEAHHAWADFLFTEITNRKMI